MHRRLLVPLAALLTACSADLVVPPPAPRLVVLQYGSNPTSADSLGVSAIGGAPASVYHFLHAVGVMTTVPASAFSALRPLPDSVTDTDSIECNLVDVRIATVTPPTAADSTWLTGQGIHTLLFSGKLFGTGTTATLDRLGDIVRNENILTGHLLFDCINVQLRRTS